MSVAGPQEFDRAAFGQIAAVMQICLTSETVWVILKISQKASSHYGNHPGREEHAPQNRKQSVYWRRFTNALHLLTRSAATKRTGECLIRSAGRAWSKEGWEEPCRAMSMMESDVNRERGGRLKATQSSGAATGSTGEGWARACVTKATRISNRKKGSLYEDKVNRCDAHRDFSGLILTGCRHSGRISNGSKGEGSHASDGLY